MEIKQEPKDDYEFGVNCQNGTLVQELFSVKEEEEYNDVTNIIEYDDDNSFRVVIKSEEIISDIKYGFSRDDESSQEAELIPKWGRSVELPYKCDFPECNYKALRLYDVRVHHRRHTGEKPFKCNFQGCNFSASKSSNITDHKRRHTGERPFKCDFKGCDATFTRSTSRTKHKRMHSGERPYKCDFKGCNMTFSQLYTVTTHKYLHTGVRRYKCQDPNCNSAFSQKTTLKNHIKVCRGKSSAPLKGSKYQKLSKLTSSELGNGT